MLNASRGQRGEYPFEEPTLRHREMKVGLMTELNRALPVQVVKPNTALPRSKNLAAMAADEIITTRLQRATMLAILSDGHRLSRRIE